MKKSILLLIIILFAACTPSKPLSPTATATADPSPLVMAAQSRTVPPPGGEIPATDTAKPQPTPTETPLPPTITPLPTLAYLVYHKYDPAEWERIPGSEDTPWGTVFLDPNHWLWIFDTREDRQDLLHYDGKEWGKVSLNELPYTDIYHIRCMNPDGTIWLMGRQRQEGKSYLIRYKHSQIDAFPIPDATDNDRIALTHDHNQGIWAFIDGYNQKPSHLYHFDGLQWQKYPLPFDDKYLMSSYLETDAKGDPWLIVGGNIGFARFNGTNWHEYEARDYWKKAIEAHQMTMRFAPGPDGSAWVERGLSLSEQTIYRFYPNGRIDKIITPFLGRNFSFDNKLFVDKENYFWLMATYNPDLEPPLLYWDGRHWNTFAHVPFEAVSTTLQQDNSMFFQTNTGWYWYTPQR